MEQRGANYYETERRKNTALYNERLIQSGRLSRREPQTNWEKWAQRRVKREKERKQRKLRDEKRDDPPSYFMSQYYQLPNIPPPPYESYEEYQKRINKK